MIQSSRTDGSRVTGWWMNVCNVSKSDERKKQRSLKTITVLAISKSSIELQDTSPLDKFLTKVKLSKAKIRGKKIKGNNEQLSHFPPPAPFPSPSTPFRFPTNGQFLKLLFICYIIFLIPHLDQRSESDTDKY